MEVWWPVWLLWRLRWGSLWQWCCFWPGTSHSRWHMQARRIQVGTLYIHMCMSICYSHWWWLMSRNNCKTRYNFEFPGWKHSAVLKPKILNVMIMYPGAKTVAVSSSSGNVTVMMIAATDLTNSNAIRDQNATRSHSSRLVSVPCQGVI